jgi:YfdX protein
MFKKSKFITIYATILGICLVAAAPVFAEESTSAKKPQEKSTESESVQPQVDKKTTDEATKKREEIIGEASAALKETEKALKALDEKKNKEALAALEVAVGKLELILAREPELAFAPIGVDIVTHDLYADLDTIQKAIKEAEDYLEDGEIQKARPLVASLASEIVFRTKNIPLATYPDAIKAVTPLIDKGKIEEAKTELQIALSTLVVTEDVIPLPSLRATHLLEEAEKLAENKERSEEDNETLSNLLKEVRAQLQMAELLGYATKESYQYMYDQIDQIERKIEGGKGGKGWFDKIKQQLSELF